MDVEGGDVFCLNFISINEDETTSRVEGRDVARRFLSLLRFYIRCTGAQSTANALTIEEVRDFL